MKIELDLTPLAKYDWLSANNSGKAGAAATKNFVETEFKKELEKAAELIDKEWTDKLDWKKSASSIFIAFAQIARHIAIPRGYGHSHEVADYVEYLGSPHFDRDRGLPL